MAPASVVCVLLLLLSVLLPVMVHVLDVVNQRASPLEVGTTFP